MKEGKGIYMLNIFTSIELIPKEKKFINDNEKYFEALGFYSRKVVEPILKYIEHGSWRDRTTFTDRFGVTLYSDCVSTGTKTLINITSSNDVFNGCEMGENAINYLFSTLDGNVYLKPTFDFKINSIVDVSNILVDGQSVGSIDELEDKLCI